MSEQTNSSPTERRELLRRQQQAHTAAGYRMKAIVRAVWIVGVLAVAVVVGVTVWTVGTARRTSSTAALVTPASATEAGAIRFGKDGAKVTVAVYADFMCPYCGRFERTNGEALQRAADAGTIMLDIHPMSFLDAQSAGARYSTRAANAFVTLAEVDPAVALRFNQLVFAEQPSEGTAGPTDEELAALASQAGAARDVVTTLRQERFVPWVDQITQRAFDAGITGTPTVTINGKVFTGDLYTPGVLAAAIRQATSGA